MTLEVANVSPESWSEATGDHVAYHWRLADGTVLVWDGDRTQLPNTLAPGGSVRLAVAVRAPEKPGRFLLEPALVREGVCWFRPPAALVPAEVYVLPRLPFLAGGMLAGTLLAWGVAWRGRKRPWVVGLLPVLWLPVFAFVVARVFAIAAKAEGKSLEPLVFGAFLVSWPVALFPWRWRGVGAGLLGLLFTFVAFADTLYVRFFGSVIPFAAWRGAGQLGQVWGSVVALLAPQDLWFAVLALAALSLGLWPRAEAPKGPLVRWVPLGLVLLFLVASGPLVGKLYGLLRQPKGAQVFSYLQRSRELSLWGVHALDAVSSVRDLRRGGAPPEVKERVREFFAQRAAEAPEPGVHFGAAKGLNLVLIQVESLQNFVVGLSVAGQEVTPFLNSLRKRGLYFSWVFDQSNQGRSSDGEFITLNSQHALAQGAAVFRAAGNRFLALPEILRQRGYHTLSAHPFERGFWNRAVLHPKYGFERSFFKRELGPGEVIGWGLADDPFFQKMLPILSETPEPFFAFLITLGLHHPFDAFPAARKTLALPDLGDPALANYLQAMRYFDASLERFFQGLERRGLARRTVVALYGDHEAGIPLQAPLANTLGIPFSWPRLVWLRRVPLFIVTPDPAVAGEVEEVGGHVDIAPTLLYLLGIPRPRWFVGRALVPGRGGFAALADGAAVDGERIWEVFQGECAHRQSLSPLPAEACWPLRQKAALELSASQAVVEYDLIPELAR